MAKLYLANCQKLCADMFVISSVYTLCPQNYKYSMFARNWSVRKHFRLSFAIQERIRVSQFRQNNYSARIRVLNFRQMFILRELGFPISVKNIYSARIRISNFHQTNYSTRIRVSDFRMILYSEKIWVSYFRQKQLIRVN